MPRIYLIYLDVNNLYGVAMRDFKLPEKDFKWISVDRYDDVIATDSESPTGYILEVALQYPPHLHDDHNDLPLCPVKQVTPTGHEEKLVGSLRQTALCHPLPEPTTMSPAGAKGQPRP